MSKHVAFTTETHREDGRVAALWRTRRPATTAVASRSPGRVTLADPQCTSARIEPQALQKIWHSVEGRREASNDHAPSTPREKPRRPVTGCSKADCELHTKLKFRAVKAAERVGRTAGCTGRAIQGAAIGQRSTDLVCGQRLRRDRLTEPKSAY